jgi:serine/threonine-protein kinase RsbW
LLSILNARGQDSRDRTQPRQQETELRETTAAAPSLARSRTFPAAAEQVREARRFLAAVLDGHPAADEAVLCLSELAANATVHSRSRLRGGHFTVDAELRGDRLRVEVHDQGGPWTWLPRDNEPHGRGLLIVSQLASTWGRNGDSSTGWTVWFEMHCPDSATSPGAPYDTCHR